MTEFGHTQEQLSRALGKSRSHIANAVRLLDLPEPVQALVDEGKLSAGHARALVGLANADALARAAVTRQLNVRQMEAIARGIKQGRAAPIPPIPSADVRALEHRLAQAVGLKVDVKARGATGEVVIHYATLDQLDDIVARLMQGKPS
jgi:ParB family chromosome partitioning protein